MTLSVHALDTADAAAAADLASRASDVVIAGEMQAEAFRLRAEAALSGADLPAMDQLASWVEQLPPARRLPLFLAGRARLRAELAQAAGDPDAARGLEREAEDVFRRLDTRPLLVGALLDRVRRRGDELALAEARQILEDLGATRWLEQLPSRCAGRLVG